MSRYRRIGLMVGAMLVVAACALTLTKPAEAKTARITGVYVTGYSYYDNTPPGSSAIAFPRSDGFRTKHNHADGTGTYSNPITVAAGWTSDGRLGSSQFPIDRPGRRFYSPWMKKYFMVEDQCGDYRPPQSGPCWNLNYRTNDAPPGTRIWIDLWVDGQGRSKGISDWCMSRITGLYNGKGFLYRPGRGLPVRKGDVTSFCERIR